MVEAKVSYHLPVNATDLPRDLQSYYFCNKKWCVLLLLTSVVPQRRAHRLFCVTKLDVLSIDLIWHDTHWLHLLLFCRSLSTLHWRLSPWSWPFWQLLIGWAELKQVSIFSLDNSHHSNNYQYYDVLEGFRMVLTIAVLLLTVSQHGDSAYAYNFPIVLFTL